MRNKNISATSYVNQFRTLRKSTMNTWIKPFLCIALYFYATEVGASIFRNPAVFMYPLKASCNITWTFGGNCSQVSEALQNQMKLWESDTVCGSGQKCLFHVTSVEEDALKAVHIGPKTRSTHDLSFAFYPNRATHGCNVIGVSKSRKWYAILDKGTNYCSLHNLVDGSGLRRDELYSELTRDEICTQYTSANCDLY